MKNNGRGSIINMCSTASIMGGPNIFAYAASKSAIRSMTKSIACLSAQNGYGFRCN
jgi:3(or 17)beta-hydroxysteroid dehydrogenase